MATNSNNPRYIYLVDDDQEDRELFSEALAQVDGAVSLTEFQNGLNLIDTLKNPESPKPEIIFLDINMPKLNGLEILRALKTSPQFRHLKVVILSTYSHDNYIEEAYRYGANCFYVKPTRFENLRSIISNALLSNWRATGMRRKENFLVRYAG